MPYFIYTTDREGGEAIRDEHRAAHIGYLESVQAHLIASGGVQDETGKFVGGLIIVDYETRAEVDEFIANDPFDKAGLFGSVTVSRWRQTFLHGRLDRGPFVPLQT